jgi:hypothetical protein
MGQEDGRGALDAQMSRKSNVRDERRMWEGKVTALTAASLVRNGVEGPYGSSRML